MLHNFKFAEYLSDEMNNITKLKVLNAVLLGRWNVAGCPEGLQGLLAQPSG